MNILVVDDERLFVLFLNKVITEIGHNVITAYSGPEAVRLFNENIDLLISDINMPGEYDGIESAYKICEKKNVPIIFLSGDKLEKHSKRLNKLLNWTYISKNMITVDTIKNIILTSEIGEVEEEKYMKEKTFDVLIVDDDNDVLKSFEIGLSETGYNLTLETDSRRALELYKKNNFHLVITDYRMPGMNGLKLLKKIREYDNYAKVIIISAFGEYKSVLEAINNHAAGFFKKPINLIEVIDFLKDLENKIRSEKNKKNFSLLKNMKQELLDKYEALIEEKISLRNNLDIK